MSRISKLNPRLSRGTTSRTTLPYIRFYPSTFEPGFRQPLADRSNLPCRRQLRLSIDSAGCSCRFEITAGGGHHIRLAADRIPPSHTPDPIIIFITYHSLNSSAGKQTFHSTCEKIVKRIYLVAGKAFILSYGISRH